LIVLTLSSAGFSWLLADRLSTVNEVNSVKQRHAINFRGSVHDRAILIRDIALAADAADMRASIEEIRALEAAYTASAGPLDAFFNDDIADQPAEAEIAWLGVINEFIDLQENLNKDITTFVDRSVIIFEVALAVMAVIGIGVSMYFLPKIRTMHREEKEGAYSAFDQ